MDYLLTQLPWFAHSLARQLPLGDLDLPDLGEPLYERLGYEMNLAWRLGAKTRAHRARMIHFFQDWFQTAAEHRLSLSKEQSRAAYKEFLTLAHASQTNVSKPFNPYVRSTLWEEVKVDLRKRLENPVVRNALGTHRNSTTSYGLVIPSFVDKENLEEGFKMLLVISSYDVLCYLSTLRTVTKEEILNSSVVTAYGALYEQLNLPEDPALGNGTIVVELTNQNAIETTIYSTIYTSHSTCNLESFRNLYRNVRTSAKSTLKAYNITYADDLEAFMSKRARDLLECGLGDLKLHPERGGIHNALLSTALQSRYLAKYYGKRGFLKIKADPGSYGTSFRMYSVLPEDQSPLDHQRLTLTTHQITDWRDFRAEPGEFNLELPY